MAGYSLSSLCLVDCQSTVACQTPSLVDTANFTPFISPLNTVFHVIPCCLIMVAYRLVLGLCGLATIPATCAASPGSSPSSQYCSVIRNGESSAGCKPVPSDFSGGSGASSGGPKADNKVLEDAFQALAKLQNDYFDPAQQTWPTSIHWTAAVIQTVMSGMMSTLTKSINATVPDKSADWKQKENLLSFLHEQVVASYFGQAAEAIKGEVRFVLHQQLPTLSFFYTD